MSLAFRTTMVTIKGLTHGLCRIDSRSLEQVPAQGPLILVCNHINFLDAPLLYTQLMPRPLTGFAKSETWDSPFLRPLFNLGGAIPVRRGEADMSALRGGLAALEKGYILVITPEGTRSGDGRLAQGHPGVVTLATRSGAPIQPVAYYGGERLYTNLRRLRRTDFHIRVGKPFRVETKGASLTSALRRQITDEIMYRLAALLPAAYRGVYADLDGATSDYLRFESKTPGNNIVN